MSANFEALEADFQAVYAIDLRDALWGAAKIGVRRLLSFVRGLPEDSRTWQAVQRAQELAEQKSPEHMAKVLGGAIRFTGRKAEA